MCLGIRLMSPILKRVVSVSQWAGTIVKSFGRSTRSILHSMAMHITMKELVPSTKTFVQAKKSQAMLGHWRGLFTWLSEMEVQTFLHSPITHQNGALLEIWLMDLGSSRLTIKPHCCLSTDGATMDNCMTPSLSSVITGASYLALKTVAQDLLWQHEHSLFVYVGAKSIKTVIRLIMRCSNIDIMMRQWKKLQQ